VSGESHRRDDESAILLALFRYGVIAPLLEGEDFARGAKTALVREIAAQTHHLPGRGPIQVKQRTVWAWLRHYHWGGIEALRPKWRKDKGMPRVLSEQVIQRAIRLRKENPRRWTSTLLDILTRDGTLKRGAVPHRSTLDRHLDRRGASRRRMRVLGEKRTIKMKFDNFGDLWVGDYHHGPVILGPDGKPTTSKLGGFIDHTSRYPVADRYYVSEAIGTLRDTLMRALLKWGPPRKVYVDRGTVYRAEQLAYSLHRIDCHLIHSRRYYSQGRGVIEKWWQVAGQFEAEVSLRDDLLTVHELNRLWEAYRELRYCEAVHSELGMTPNEAIANVVPKPIDPSLARELFLVRAKRKVNKKDACVPVVNQRFLCDSFLRDREVEVRFDPNDLSSVLIFFEGKRVQRAFPQRLNDPPEPHPEPLDKARQSVDYLALVRRDYDQALLEHARPLAYAQLRCEPDFDKQGFIDVVGKLAGLTLRPADNKDLGRFWDSYAPIPESLVRIGVEHAVRLHGRGRHREIYLNAVRTLVLAHWRNPDEKGKDPT
jgi:putative transposase